MVAPAVVRLALPNAPDWHDVFHPHLETPEKLPKQRKRQILLELTEILPAFEIMVTLTLGLAALPHALDWHGKPKNFPRNNFSSGASLSSS